MTEGKFNAVVLFPLMIATTSFSPQLIIRFVFGRQKEAIKTNYLDVNMKSKKVIATDIRVVEAVNAAETSSSIAVTSSPLD